MALGRLRYTDKDYKFLLEETYKLAYIKYPIVKVYVNSSTQYDTTLRSYRALEFQDYVTLPFQIRRSYQPGLVDEIAGQLPIQEGEITGFVYYSVVQATPLLRSFSLDHYRQHLQTSVLPTNTLIEYQGQFYRLLDSWPTNFVGDDFFIGIGCTLELLQRGTVVFRSIEVVDLWHTVTTTMYSAATMDSTTLDRLYRTFQQVKVNSLPLRLRTDFRYITAGSYYTILLDLNKYNFSSVQVTLQGDGATLNLTPVQVNKGYVGDYLLGIIEYTLPADYEQLTISLNLG